MPKKRKPIENLEELVYSKRKKYVKYSEGAVLYSMSVNTFRKLARDAKAVYKINRIVLVDINKVDQLLEAFHVED